MKRDKTFLKLWISYISIILITVAVIGVLTVSTLLTRLNKDTEKLNENIINQTEKILDTEFGNILSLPYQLLTDREFQNILSIQYASQTDKVYESWKAIRELYSYQTRNTSITNVAIYSKKNDLILDSQAVYSEREYYNLYFENSGFNYEEWTNFLDSGNLTHFFVSAQINNESVSEEVVIYCQGLRREDPENGGLFMAFINKEAILQRLKIDDLSQPFAFAIIGRDGKVMLKAGDFDIEPDASLFDGGKGEFNYQGYNVVYDMSNVLDIKYVYLFPNNAFLGGVSYALPAFLLILLLAVAVSVIAAHFSAKNMQRSILAILDENKLLAKNLDEYMSISREQLFLNLLYNIPLKEKEQTAVNDLKMKHRLFRVFVVKGTERDRFDVYNEQIAAAWKEVDKIIADMLELLPVEFFAVRTSEASYVYILNYDHSESVSKGIRSVTNEFTKQYGIYIMAAVGGEVEDIHHINSSYEGAMFALRYNYGKSRDSVVFCDDIEHMENQKLYYTAEKEQLLIRNMRTGAADEVAGLFDEIYRVNYIERRLSQEVLKRLNLHILLLLFKILDEAYTPEDEKNEHYMRVCQNILHNDDAEGAYQILKEVCISLCRELPEQKGEAQLKSKIESYLLQNCSDADLSLNMLADHIGMSYNYLSKVFKDVFGTNFVSYVTAIRLEQAKQLLKTTDLTVEQIAQRAGFGRSNSFIKTFKKYYNVTPGQFRSRDGNA